jgi:hypothetical protein
MHGGAEVNGNSEFRGPEQEVLRLLEECAELRATLKAINAQIGRMERRVRNAFPNVATQARHRASGAANLGEATITSEQALAEFDRIVGLAASGANDDAQRVLDEKSAADLRVIAKELGVSLTRSKLSIKTMREAVLGKVRESVLLSKHSRRT